MKKERGKRSRESQEGMFYINKDSRKHQATNKENGMKMQNT